MIKNKVDIITLGCSKNLVDTEHLLRQFQASGYTIEHNPKQVNGEIVVVNTCGFIEDAQTESIETILELGKAKKQRHIKKLIVMGCLSERFMNDLIDELPEVDKFYGKFNWTEMLADLGKSYDEKLSAERVITTPPHYTYIKISEGCNRFCAFCAIPLITGRHKSVTMENLIDEVKLLVDKGVKEFNVIAQDLSSYGMDLYGQQKLPELIDRMSMVKGVEWIRLHYAYPTDFPVELIDVMANRENVCNYLDIALQHINDKVLSNMRRHIDRKATEDLIGKIRTKLPDIHLRTTLMVGFPGEGDDEYNELLEWVKDMRFERMGAFAYSEETGTYASKNYDDNIPAEVKQERLSRLMELQEKISLELQEQKVGSTQRVVVDREEEDYFIGRTQYDSPEVDPEVLINKEKPLIPGEFYNVKIEEALPFELIGSVI